MPASIAAIALFRELIASRSVFGEEHGAIAIVERELARMGVETIAVPFEPETLALIPGAQAPISTVPGRRNLIARVRGTGGGRSLILNCHLDIVPEGDATKWQHPPFSGVVEGGRIHGRGALDDKAGVVITLGLLERFAANPPGGDLIAHFVLEDEITGNGSLLCLAHGPAADAAIIVDGTKGDRGINAHAGNVRFGVSVAGRPASVSVSHMGVNAAELLAELLLDIRAAVFALNASNTAPWTQYPSPNQLSVLSLDARELTLTVPSQASATCYATFTPPLGLAAFRSRVTGVVKAFALSRCLESEPQIDWSGFGAEPVASSSAALEAVIRASAGSDVPFGPSTGTSDLRHFAARGIPCVLFGPGRGDNPHRADESFDLASLDETSAVLGRTIEAWCYHAGQG
jgi:acetylornithine deacetylase